MPDLFLRLKPLYGKAIDLLWVEHQIADVERKREIEEYLTLLAVKRFGLTVGGEDAPRLEPPPPDVIGTGDYTLGTIAYPGLESYPVRVRRNELLRHVFLLGPTGTGKSTCLLGMLLQLLGDGAPVMVFDFKRNYRCLLASPVGRNVVVFTVGSATAPLALNALVPPAGAAIDEWAEALSDIISTSYLLMQGARNVLKEALLAGHRAHGSAATLRHAHELLVAELGKARAGSRRYGWLESSARSLEELTKGGFGNALSATNPGTIQELLNLSVVFELESLGEDQRSFFCLFLLQAILLIRKHQELPREELHHVLVFDESHNVFPRERPGELGIPSRLAREVREFGEAIIAATQQADVSESLIANSGIKIILRTDYPRDVTFASQLMHVDPRFLPRLRLGTGIARLPVRYYEPFLLCFPPQPLKNTMVPDATVKERWESAVPARVPVPSPVIEAPLVTPKEDALLRDVHSHPIATITGRYERLGWNPKTGNALKDTIIAKGLARFDPVTTPTGIVKILGLTENGHDYLDRQGVRRNRIRHGGPEHEYWKHIIAVVLERDGWAVVPEAPVGGGRTVDIHAIRDIDELWIEVETGRSDIAANVEKLQGVTGRKVFVFTTRSLRETHVGLVEALGPGARALTTADLDSLVP